MIVERLRLKNFRSYAEEDVAFEPGVTLFEGDIGSGKSSLLFAIEFALFGLADVPGEHLLRAGEREGVIELTFRSGGKRYTVGRRLSRTKSGGANQKDAFLEADGAKEDFSVEQLRGAVIKVLGFREGAATKSKSQVFRYGVFTPQEEMKAILEQGGEERKQTLRRAFGIEQYKRARENADAVKAALRERAAALEAVLEDLPRLEEERSLAAGTRDGFMAQAHEAQGQRAIAQADRRQAEGALRAGEALEAQEREAERALAALEVDRAKQAERQAASQKALADLAAIEGEVGPLREAAGTLPALEERLAAAEALEEERRRLDRELAGIEAKLKQLERRREEVTTESEILRKVTGRAQEVRMGKKALDEARAALEAVREQAAAAREAAEQVEALAKRVAGLEREAAAIEGLAAKVKEREALEREGGEAASTLAALEARAREAQEAQGAARTALGRIEADLEELASLKGKARCPKCRQPLSEGHLADHKAELERDAKAARMGLAQAQARARALVKERAELEKAREAGERAGRERAAMEAELKRCQRAGEEAWLAAKDLALARASAERAEGLAAKRRELERDVQRHLAFEKAAVEVEQAAKRWREVSDQYRRVVKEADDTARAARETRAAREKSSGLAADLKSLREAVSSARIRSLRLKDLERRLATRQDLERHRREAQAALAAIATSVEAAASLREDLARRLQEAPLKALRARFEAAASREAALEERLKAAREGLALQEDALRRAEARLGQAARSRGRLDQVRRSRDFVEQCFQVALEDVELKVLTDLNSQLNSRFEAYFARLMEGAPVDVHIDAEFTPSVLQGPHALPVEALSGGERTSIALAYRLALNGLVSRAAGMESPDLLILDEPTDGFSKEQLARVGELLRDLDCQQVVLVSHERELEACADQVFEVVKDGTVSKVIAR